MLAGMDREFDGRYRNPLSLLLLTNQFGLGAEWQRAGRPRRSWRVGAAASTLQAQLGIDDLQYEQTSGADRYPNRWALTLAAFGPLGPHAGLARDSTPRRRASPSARSIRSRISPTPASGIGRNFDDMDQSTYGQRAARRTRWLLTPELTLLRQGEGEINASLSRDACRSGGDCRRSSSAWSSGRGAPRSDLQRPPGSARPHRQRRGSITS